MSFSWKTFRIESKNDFEAVSLKIHINIHPNSRAVFELRLNSKYSESCNFNENDAETYF